MSQHEIEVHLYLNQMGVFNLVDDGSVSGCASLKLRYFSNLDNYTFFMIN